MSNEALRALIHEDIRSLAIIGLSKNAGKTTVLNHILALWQEEKLPGTLALSSIGRDGEDEDLCTATVKPRIYLAAGTLVVTARAALARADALLDLLSLSGIHSSLGEIVVCRALSDGYVELAGPAAASDLKRCEALCRELDEHCLFLVDGALSRRSPAGGGITEAAILAAGAENCATTEQFEERLLDQVQLLRLPAVAAAGAEKVREIFAQSHAVRIVFADENFANFRSLRLPTTTAEEEKILDGLRPEDAYLFVRGAATDKLLQALMKRLEGQGLTLVAEDGTRLFPESGRLRQLEAKKIRLAVLHPIQLKLVCLNPQRTDGSKMATSSLLRRLSETLPVPICDLGLLLP